MFRYAPWCVLLGTPCITGAQPTIRQIDGAPFAATIVAAPAANAVAFVLNARGVRNIWVTDSTRTDARQVTAFTQDDGQDLTSLAFSADGRTLYFVRGAGPKRSGRSHLACPPRWIAGSARDGGLVAHPGASRRQRGVPAARSDLDGDDCRRFVARIATPEDAWQWWLTALVAVW